MRFVAIGVAAALTVGLVASLESSTASAQSTAQKKAKAQSGAANAMSVNDCIQLAISRGYSVNEYQSEYRNAAKKFVINCLNGKQR